MTLNELLTRVEALRGEVDALRPLDPEQEARLVQKLNLEWFIKRMLVCPKNETYPA